MKIYGGRATCLFTRLEESSLVPAGFLTAQFLQKTSFMKPLFFKGRNWVLLVFTAFLEERGSIGKLEGWWMDLPHFYFSPLNQWRETPSQFSHQNKGFINYVSCRNWAVRNPAGTRLDSSSLVNKQVGGRATLAGHPICLLGCCQTRLCPFLAYNGHISDTNKTLFFNKVVLNRSNSVQQKRYFVKTEKLFLCRTDSVRQTVLLFI